MGLHTILTLVGDELTAETVEQSWPTDYADRDPDVYSHGEFIYVYIEPPYDKDGFVADVLNRFPEIERAVLAFSHSTTDDGSALLYERTANGTVALTDEMNGEQGAHARDVIEYFEQEYEIQIWTHYEAWYGPDWMSD